MSENLDIKSHFQKLKKALRLLENDTRFRITGYLIIFNKLGLSDLS